MTPSLARIVREQGANSILEVGERTDMNHPDPLHLLETTPHCPKELFSPSPFLSSSPSVPSHLYPTPSLPYFLSPKQDLYCRGDPFEPLQTSTGSPASVCCIRCISGHPGDVPGSSKRACPQRCPGRRPITRQGFLLCNVFDPK